jgi:spherulation-specific family 4 protein
MQALAIPMYIDPPAPAWTMETSAASQVPLLVANPNSGPGSSADSAYTQAIATAQAAGQTIIGYIHTSYGARGIAQVQADIDSWYSFYPAIDGIFSDETATAASLVASYYAPLYSYVKAKGGKAVVVINPGTPPDESYMTASDIVLSFEDTYANYVSAQTPSWAASYPSARFWHIVLSATQTEMTTAVSLARQRNVGLVYVTDQGPATAYQQIVTGAYWEAELAAVTAP